MKTRLRPTRSAVDPASISSAASTSVYASIAHWSPDVLAPKSRCMAGRATLRIVLSMLTISRLMQQMASTSRRRRWVGSGMAAIVRPFR